MPTEDYINTAYDMLDEVISDSEEVQESRSKSVDLGILSDKIQEMRLLEREIVQLDEAAKAKKKELAKISEEDIPNYLQQYGISSLVLTDGSKVVVEDTIMAGISEEHRDEAFRWLREHDEDGIIKNEYVVPFSKGQDQDAAQFAAKLRELGVSYEKKESVHWQTLRAWVRGYFEKGKLSQIPADMFSIFPKKITKVVAPRGSKA